MNHINVTINSRASWPSSQAIRYCRPLMVTLI